MVAGKRKEQRDMWREMADTEVPVIGRLHTGTVINSPQYCGLSILKYCHVKMSKKIVKTNFIKTKLVK